MLSDILIDLLTEFDEMGFCPTNLCESPEEYAIDWKKDLIVAIEDEKEEVAREILQDLKEYIAYESKPFIKWGSDNSQNEIPDACIDSDMLNNKIDEIAKEYDVEL